MNGKRVRRIVCRLQHQRIQCIPDGYLFSLLQRDVGRIVIQVIDSRRTGDHIIQVRMLERQERRQNLCN